MSPTLSPSPSPTRPGSVFTGTGLEPRCRARSPKGTVLVKGQRAPRPGPSLAPTDLLSLPCSALCNVLARPHSSQQPCRVEFPSLALHDHEAKQNCVSQECVGRWSSSRLVAGRQSPDPTGADPGCQQGGSVCLAAQTHWAVEFSFPGVSGGPKSQQNAPRQSCREELRRSHSRGLGG